MMKKKKWTVNLPSSFMTTTKIIKSMYQTQSLEIMVSSVYDSDGLYIQCIFTHPLFLLYKAQSVPNTNKNVPV